MNEQAEDAERRFIVDTDAVQALIAGLQSDGYRVLGPKVRDGAIVLETLSDAGDLPAGWTDTQEAGSYRLERRADERLFAHGPAAQAWKRALYPPTEVLWRARRDGAGFVIEDPNELEPQRFAFFGVRPCDLRGLDVLDRVLGEGHANDPAYGRRREEIFIVAVNCTDPGGTCFCVSMGGGPSADGGFDLALTELASESGGQFLLEVGSPLGHDRLARLERRIAETGEIEAADTALAAAAQAMGRTMVENVADLLARNRVHPRWLDTADRCLTCGNCTMVCPTCFCADIEDTTDVTGDTAERRRHWTSCFTLEHSYIHGGSVRFSGASRYRQWISHKLSDWHEQFGVSGCVGCGRCITWCPVGIDITEEARAIRDHDGETHAWS